jgi:DNA-binding response OmpR family regulator
MKRILVVNDTEVLLDMFKLLLEDAGYEVVLTDFPAQQVKDIERINPDLIILDFMFGHENLGLQMLQMLKMYPTTRNIPVIVSSAALDVVRQQQEYLKSQGVAVIYKPFDIDELLGTIKQLFLKHR